MCLVAYVVKILSFLDTGPMGIDRGKNVKLKRAYWSHGNCSQGGDPSLGNTLTGWVGAWVNRSLGSWSWQKRPV